VSWPATERRSMNFIVSPKRLRAVSSSSPEKSAVNQGAP